MKDDRKERKIMRESNNKGMSEKEELKEKKRKKVERYKKQREERKINCEGIREKAK